MQIRPDQASITRDRQATWRAGAEGEVRPPVDPASTSTSESVEVRVPATGDPSPTLGIVETALGERAGALGEQGAGLPDRLATLAARALAPLAGSLSGGPAVVAMQVPAPTLLGFGKAAPSDLPEALWKACGKDDSVARPHAERLRALHCNDADRAAIATEYARIVGAVDQDTDLAPLLAMVDGKPDAAVRLQAFGRLLGVSHDMGRAQADLQLADQAATRAGCPFPEAASALGALRGFDPSLGDYSPQWMNLEPTLDFALAGADPGARAARLQDMVAICKLKRSPEAAHQQAQRLAALPPASPERTTIGETWLGLLKAWESSSDRSLLEGFDRAMASPDRLAALRDFTTLVEACARPVQAALDFQVAINEAGKGRVPRGEVVGVLESLRRHDPNRSDSYEGLADVAGALDHVLAGATSTDRSARLQYVLDVQQNGRSAASAAPLAVRVERLGCPSEQKAAIAEDLKKLVRERGSSDDPAVMLVLDCVDGPQALRGWQGFRTLLAAGGRADVAAADLQLAQEAATGRGIPFQEVVGQLEAMRKADPNRDDSYEALADVKPALQETLKAGDAVGRAQALQLLLSLQDKGRSLPQAQPFMEAMVALQAGPHANDAASALATLHELRKAYSSSSDNTLLAALHEAAASSQPAACLQQFASQAKLTGRPEQALADMQLAREEAAAHGVPTAEVMQHLDALRKIDPAREDSYESYANARPALEEILQAPDPAGRQAILDHLLELHQKGRSATQAVPFLQALHAVKAGPSGAQAETVRTALVTLLKAWSSSSDAPFLELLKDLPGRADAASQVRQFVALLDVTGRPEQALADVRLARNLAASSSCDQAVITEAMATLRKADPARGDSYETFADLGPTLATLLKTAGGGSPPSREQLNAAVSEFLALQQKGRNAESALRHAGALAGIQAPSQARADLQRAYGELLKKWSGEHDDQLLEVLALASATPDPRATLDAFVALVGSVAGRVEVALDDFKTAQQRGSVAGGPSVSEFLTLIESLRKGDPAREDNYETYESLAPALDWITQAADPAGRAQRTERLVAVQATGRTLLAATKLESRLDALKVTDADGATVREQVPKLLKSMNADSDGQLLEVLDVVDGHADAGALVNAYARLLGVSARPWTALADLAALEEAVQSTHLPLDEVCTLLARVRKGDPALVDGWEKPGDVAPALGVVVQGSDAADRGARAESVARLFLARGDANEAARDLQWILAGPLPKGDLAEGTRKMELLAGRLKGEASDVRAIHRHMQEHAQGEKVPWWQRLLRMHGPYERTVTSAVGLSSEASTLLALLESLERARFEGEDVRAAYQRVNKLIRLEPRDEYTAPDLDAARKLAEHATRVPAWGAAKSDERWDAIRKLTKELESMRAADAVWCCMASAATEAEAHERRQAFDRLLEFTRDYPSRAAAVYEALVDDLGPGDSIMSRLPEMTKLLEKQAPDVAAETWRVARGSRNLSDSDRRLVESVLGHASDAEGIHALWKRIETPVGSEPLAVRADMLRALMDQVDRVDVCLSRFDAVLGALPGEGELEKAGSAYVALVQLLQARMDDPMPQARELVEWLRTMQAGMAVSASGSAPAQASPAVATPLADLLLTLTGHLVLGADVDRAKTLVRSEEERRQRELLNAPRAGIDVGETEINVGGVRIKVRQKQEGAE